MPDGTLGHTDSMLLYKLVKLYKRLLTVPAVLLAVKVRAAREPLVMAIHHAVILVRVKLEVPLQADNAAVTTCPAQPKL